MAWKIIDGDGHVMEDWRELVEYMPEPYRRIGRFQGQGRLFPPLDHLHGGTLYSVPPGSFRKVDANDWLEFMDDVGIEKAVLYGTQGLSFGKVITSEFAVDGARAYNNWLRDAYLARSPRFQCLGLIPLQEPDEAVAELRRIVTELGFCGALIPSTGFKGHLGGKEYWPIYREADRLGCCLAIHGGAHEGLGMDWLTPFAPVNALGHPFGLMVAFAGIVFNGIFDKFPNARIGFMEGGASWLQMCMERFERAWETHIQYDPKGEYIQLREGESVADYVRKHIAEGRIFIGCEGGEPTLSYILDYIGHNPFIFSSDFPHEVNNERCKHELAEIEENPKLAEADKHAILYANAERFYGLTTAR